MTAPKNGFFYILDAKTGKVLSAKPLVQTTWASAYDVQTQKPILIPASQGGGRQWTVHNWWPMSYDTLTGLVYIPTTDHRPDTKAPAEAGEGGEGLFGRLVAWVPIAEAARWSADEASSVNGGVLSTVGNLVIQRRGTDELAASAVGTGNNSTSRFIVRAVTRRASTAAGPGWKTAPCRICAPRRRKSIKTGIKS